MKKQLDKKRRRRYRDWGLPTMVVYSPLRSLFWNAESDTWCEVGEACHLELTLETAKICPLPEDEIVFMTVEKAGAMVSKGDYLHYLAYAHRVQPVRTGPE